ncbi:VOC family protein [Sphingopyxis sp. KK2]|uniref:VOC family protein n=1 Tax=Sphingopyxis sp. KK2 TaxID=1855727 RepID=UPI00097E67BF|nr:VOC family protein [Sphingopyxis sp. KK2]
MSGTSPFIQVTPFLGVAAMEAALGFYRDTLGFTVFVDQGGYAYVERERVAFRLLQLDDGARNAPGCSHAYVDVVDAQALFGTLHPALAQLPADCWGPPRDHDYGQREFWVRDPDGNLITFGEGIGLNANQWDYRR